MRKTTMGNTFHRTLRKLKRWLISSRLFQGGAGYYGSVVGGDNLIQAEGAQLNNVELDIIGDRNRITFGEGAVLYNLVIRMRGSDHRLEIGRGCRLSRGGTFWFEDQGCELRIGDRTTLVEVHIAVTEPGSKVTIGSDCMLANDIDIRSGDSHSIIEAASSERVNFAENVIIADHVWIAAHAIILKGVQIGSNSVVASGAVVTHSCGEGVILAGNPAKIIKSGITWKRERIAKKEGS